MPWSASGAAPGSCGEALSDVTASAFSFPPFTCGVTRKTEPIASGTWPPSASIMSGPPPR